MVMVALEVSLPAPKRPPERDPTSWSVKECFSRWSQSCFAKQLGRVPLS